MAALAIDSRIPNKIMSRDQALQEAEQELSTKYGHPDPEPRKEVPQDPLRGTSNTVKIYKRKYGGQYIKFAVREASYASFEISPDNTLVTEHVSLLPEYKSDSQERRTVAREEFLKEVIDTENNWKAAAHAGVSPELYFYGYIKHGSTNFLKNVIISEAFDMDLNKFWVGDGVQFMGHQDALRKSNDMQKAIASQLVALFTVMANNMGMICFDIKPQNTVIKFDVDAQGRPILNKNFVVKLIDWDADWCRNYPTMLNSRDGVARENFRKAATVAMIMVMANFFYEYWNFNILRDVMVAFYNADKEGNLFTTTKTMMTLFEAGQFGGPTTDFSFMAKHYFKIGSKGMTQEQFLHEMFKRSISRDRAEYAMRLAFKLGRDLIVRGGKKRRKTRRKYKRKTKRVQTKKRRRKSNIKKKRKTRRKKRISKKKRN